MKRNQKFAAPACLVQGVSDPEQSKPLSFLVLSFLDCYEASGTTSSGNITPVEGGPQLGRSWAAARSMCVNPPGELIITRQAQWIMTLELLETPLKLSWPPLGVPETSQASRFDAQSSFGENFVLIFPHLTVSSQKSYFGLSKHLSR